MPRRGGHLVINELIPVVYDTNRTVKITGDDDVELLQEINGQMADATPDVTLGKYDMSHSTGPSYATKRQEAVDVTMTLMNTMPQVGNVVADILVRNMDIPAKEIEERRPCPARHGQRRTAADRAASA